MNLTEEMRKEASKLPIIVGAVVLTIGVVLSFADSSWSSVFIAPGLLLIAYGLLSLWSQLAVNSVSSVAELASQHAIPNWDGEILHTIGGQNTVRYKYGHDGSPRFIAKDVCIAIGVKPPAKNAVKWGGASLLNYEGQFYFSRKSVEEFLTPLAFDNREANLLLANLRNEVFRKLDKLQP